MLNFLPKTRLFAWAALCSISTLISCQKKTEDPIVPVQQTTQIGTAQQRIQAIQQSFANSGQASKLIDKVGSVATLTWEPLWDKSFEIGPNVYIPLRFREKKLGALRDLYGAKRFLIYSTSTKSASSAFWLATYTFDKMAEAQYLPDSPIFLATFSGTCALHLLDGEKRILTQYKQGTKLKKFPEQAGNTSNAQRCVTVYQCTYIARCHDGSGNDYNVYTYTSAPYQCQDPTSEPCPDWGLSWYQTDSHTYEDCTYSDDDPGIQPLPDTGLYFIRNFSGGNVLTVPGASTAAGTYLAMQPLTGAANQKWHVTSSYSQTTPAGTGSETTWYYNVTSLLSNKAADAEWGATSAGTPIWQWDFNGGEAQTWAISLEGDTPNAYLVIGRGTMTAGTWLGIIQSGSGSVQLGSWRFQTSYNSFATNPNALWYFDPTTP